MTRCLGNYSGETHMHRHTERTGAVGPTGCSGPTGIGDGNGNGSTRMLRIYGMNMLIGLSVLYMASRILAAVTAVAVAATVVLN